MKNKRFYYLLIASVVFSSLIGCSGTPRTPVTQKDTINHLLEPIVLLPAFAEVHVVENSKSDITDSMWENTLKINIQKSLKKNIRKLGLKYSAPGIESLSEAEKTSLANAYIEFNATEKELIHLLNVNNNVGEVSLDSYLLPQAMQYPGVTGDKALFCKATDDYSSSAVETIKNTVMITAGIVIIAATIAIEAPEIVNSMLSGKHKQNGNIAQDYSLGPRFISCTLADLNSHKILWYNAGEISGDSKSYKNVDLTLNNILKDFPLRASL